MSVTQEFIKEYLREEAEETASSGIPTQDHGEPPKRRLNIIEESLKHSLRASRNQLRIISIQATIDLLLDRIVDDLNNIKNKSEKLTKSEKKALGGSNPKYILKFTKFTRVKSSNFGIEWHLAHERLIRDDWERTKFLANNY